MFILNKHNATLTQWVTNLFVFYSNLLAGSKKSLEVCYPFSFSCRRLVDLKSKKPKDQIWQSVQKWVDHLHQNNNASHVFLKEQYTGTFSMTPGFNLLTSWHSTIPLRSLSMNIFSIFSPCFSSPSCRPKETNHFCSRWTRVSIIQIFSLVSMRSLFTKLWRVHWVWKVSYNQFYEK